MSVNGIMTNGIMTNGVMVNGVRPIGEPVESILLIQGEEIHLR